MNKEYHASQQKGLLTDTLGQLAYNYLPPRPGTRDPNTYIITLVGGFSRTHRDFILWQKKWHQLGYGVLIYDNRGSGESHASGAFPFTQHLTDLLVLWNHLGIHRSHLIGFSMGGLITQHMAMNHTDRLASITLISSFSCATMVRSPQVGSPMYPWHPPHRYLSPGFAEKYPAMVQAFAKQMDQKNTQINQIMHQHEALIRAPTAKDHHKISVPTLVIHGASDVIVPVKYAHQIAAAVSGSIIKVYPDCGHLPLMEAGPQLWTDINEEILT